MCSITKSPLFPFGFPTPILLFKDIVVNIFIVVKKIDQNKHRNNKITDFEIFCTYLYQIEVISTKIVLAFIQYIKNKKYLDAKMHIHEFFPFLIFTFPSIQLSIAF